MTLPIQQLARFLRIFTVMKQISLLVLAVLAAVGLRAQLTLTQEGDGMTIIEFPEPEFNHGLVTEGDSVFHDFVFKNIGKEPLLIENVKPPCSCTRADWPKDPIPPGGEGKIHVAFGSEGKSGEQEKWVTIIYNGEPPIERVLLICEVVPREGVEKAPEPGQDHKE